jgi:chemotaxis signal transduction protein
VTAVQVVLLPVGKDLYGVPIHWVREVVTAPPLTPLVTGPELVLGLFNLRGEIVPLLDTAALLGVGKVGTVSFALVVQSADGPAGLAATSFPQRALLDLPSGPSELPGTAGTYLVGRQVVVLLDPAALLGFDRLGGSEPRAGAPVAGAA